MLCATKPISQRSFSMTPLRRRMTEDMQVRNFSPHTQDSYVQQVSLFARHFSKSPEVPGPEEIRSYQPKSLPMQHVLVRKPGSGRSKPGLFWRLCVTIGSPRSRSPRLIKRRGLIWIPCRKDLSQKRFQKNLLKASGNFVSSWVSLKFQRGILTFLAVRF